MAGLKGLAHIGIFTANMEKSLGFYCGMLGFEHYYSCDLNGTKLGFIKAGSCVIELIHPKEYAGGRGEGVVAHVAIEVSGIRELVAGLRAKGVKFNSEDVSVIPALFPPGSTNIFLTGPDGESLELYEYAAVTKE
jgi:catechol 2,3-dioxygenase-like lactoylglutathione lyase family enzyme